MALRELLVEFQSAFNPKGVKDGESAINTLLGKAKEAGAALAGLFAVREILDFTHATAAAADAIGDQASRLRMSTDELQRWIFVAGQAEIQQEELDGIFRKVGQSALAMAEGSKEAVAGFKELGVEAQVDGQLKPTDQLFREIGLSLAAMPDKTKAAALSFQYFGRSAGTKVLELFARGEEGISELLEQFEALGGGIDESFIKQADEADKAQKRLNTTWLVTKTRIAAVLLPTLELIVGKAIKLSTGLGKLVRDTNIVQAALATLGIVGAASGVKLLATYGKLILKFGLWGIVLAAIALGLDDVITFLQGGKSALEDFIVSVFSEDVAAEILRWRDGFASLKEPFPAILEGLESILGEMGIAIDKFFLDWYGKWNSFVTSLGFDALTIDTTKAEQELAFFQNRQKELEAKAFARENPNDAAAARRSDAEFASGQARRAFAPGLIGPPEAPKAFPVTAEDRDRLRQGAGRTDPRAQRPGAGFLEETRARNRDRAEVVGQQAREAFAPAQATATAPVLPVTSNSYTYQTQVSAPVQVSVAPGTPAQQVREIERAAQRGAAAGWRGAAAAFEQKGRE